MATTLLQKVAAGADLISHIIMAMANIASMGQTSIFDDFVPQNPLDSSTGASKSTRSLGSLPPELQLRILQFSLTTDAPLMNFGNPQLLIERPVKDERRGQDEVNLSILATCRLYHTEGWKIFWRQNTFTFVRSTSPLPSIPKLFQASQTYTMLEHLSFRHGEIRTKSEIVMSLLAMIDAAGYLPCLKTLNFDLVVCKKGKENIRSAMLEARRYYQEHRGHVQNGTAIPKRQLEEITFTGLDIDEIFLLALRLLSTLLKPEGYIYFTFSQPLTPRYALASGSFYEYQQAQEEPHFHGLQPAQIDELTKHMHRLRSYPYVDKDHYERDLDEPIDEVYEEWLQLACINE